MTFAGAYMIVKRRDKPLSTELVFHRPLDDDEMKEVLTELEKVGFHHCKGFDTATSIRGLVKLCDINKLGTVVKLADISTW